MRQRQYDSQYADELDVVEDGDVVCTDEWFDYVCVDHYEYGSDDLWHIGDGEGATAEWCDFELRDDRQWCQFSEWLYWDGSFDVYGDALEWSGAKRYGLFYDQCDGAEYGRFDHELCDCRINRWYSLGSAEQR